MKIDIGCGPNKKPDFLGVDQFPMAGVDIVMDVRKKWPWKDGEVEEAHSSHFVEHLSGLERVKFINELYRVLKPGGQCTIIVPDFASGRAYGDFTHQWPPMAAMWFYYLDKNWRMANAPHTDTAHNKAGYNSEVDFVAVWGNSLNPSLANRSADYQQYAQANYKEAVMDLHATLTKR